MSYMYKTNTQTHTQAHTSSMNKLKKRSEKRDWVVQQLCIPKSVTGSRDKASGDNLKSPALQVLLVMPALCPCDAVVFAVSFGSSWVIHLSPLTALGSR